MRNVEFRYEMWHMYFQRMTTKDVASFVRYPVIFKEPKGSDSSELILHVGHHFICYISISQTCVVFLASLPDLFRFM